VGVEVEEIVKGVGRFWEVRLEVLRVGGVGVGLREIGVEVGVEGELREERLGAGGLRDVGVEVGFWSERGVVGVGLRGVVRPTEVGVGLRGVVFCFVLTKGVKRGVGVALEVVPEAEVEAPVNFCAERVGVVRFDVGVEVGLWSEREAVGVGVDWGGGLDQGSSVAPWGGCSCCGTDSRL
jgi:hypothetical protein